MCHWLLCVLMGNVVIQVHTVLYIVMFSYVLIYTVNTARKIASTCPCQMVSRHPHQDLARLQICLAGIEMHIIVHVSIKHDTACITETFHLRPDSFFVFYRDVMVCGGRLDFQAITAFGT